MRPQFLIQLLHENLQLRSPKRLDTMPTGVHVLVPAQIVSSRR